MADIRIAVVTYHSEEFALGSEGSMTIGQAIDNMVETELKAGNLIQDVTLSLTEDERFNMQRSYQQRTLDGDGVVADGHAKTKKSKADPYSNPNYR